MPTTGIRAGAEASTGRLAYVPETNWAETPATPGFQRLRLTSENIQPSKATTRSNEVRPDRSVADIMQTGRSVAGSVNFELSYGAFDDLIEGLMFSTWSGDAIQNGADEGQSFSLERTLRLPSGSKEYHRFLGMLVNSMSLSVEASSLITGSFNLMGRFGGRDTTPIADATYEDAPQNRVLNAANHFADLSVTGGSLTEAPLIRSISLEATNNLRAQDAAGSLDAAGMGTGRFEVTGSINAYFSSGALYQSFLDHEDLALSFVVGTETGSKYRITIPTINLTGEPGGEISGVDDDLMQEISFEAKLDRLTDTGCSLMIERAVA